MAKLWVVLTIAVLIFGMRADGGQAEEEDDEDETIGDKPEPLYMKCCMAKELMPIVFKTGDDKCKRFMSDDTGTVGGASVEKRGAMVVKGEAEVDKGGAVGEMGGEKNHECLMQCMLDANGYLDASQSIKEKELRDTILRAVDKGATATLDTALNKCYGLNNGQEGEKKSPCDRIHAVFKCITTEVLENCPDDFWSTESDECREGLKKRGKVLVGDKQNA